MVAGGSPLLPISTRTAGLSNNRRWSLRWESTHSLRSCSTWINLFPFSPEPVSWFWLCGIRQLNLWFCSVTLSFVNQVYFQLCTIGLFIYFNLNINTTFNYTINPTVSQTLNLTLIWALILTFDLSSSSPNSNTKTNTNHIAYKITTLILNLTLIQINSSHILNLHLKLKISSTIKSQIKDKQHNLQ